MVYCSKDTFGLGATFGCYIGVIYDKDLGFILEPPCIDSIRI